MKRTALRRKTPMRRGTPKAWVKPERQAPRVPETPPAPRAVMARIGGAVVAVPKDEPLRSEAYRQYVASLACFACGVSGRSQAAHSNSPQHGKGKGLKASDLFIFPLCADMPSRVGCHTQHDLCIDMTLEQRRAAEEAYIERMHRRAANDGWDLATLRRAA